MSLSIRRLISFALTGGMMLAAPPAAAGTGPAPGSVAGGAPAAAAPVARPPVTCRACYLVADGGRVLYERAPDAPLPNASTTKMVTALVVMGSDVSLDQEVIVSPHAAGVGGGGHDLRAGDRFSVRELLYSLLLTSSNDASVALAEEVAGSEPAFVRRMNAFARAAGADESHFATPHGLDTPGHVATAADLAALGDLVLRNRALARIVATREAEISGVAGRVKLENRNRLLERYRGATGIKTGFTNDAGEVLVAAARRQGRVLIAVAMHSDNAAADARALLDYGFARLARTPLIGRGDAVGALVVDAGNAVPIVAAVTVRGMTNPESVHVRLTVENDSGDVRVGDVVGTISLFVRGRVVGSADAVTGRTHEADRGSWLGDLLAGLLRAAASVMGAVGQE